MRRGPHARALVRVGMSLSMGALAAGGGCYAAPLDRPAGTGGAPGATCPDVTPRAGDPCTTAEVGLSCGDLGWCNGSTREGMVTCGTNGFWNAGTCEAELPLFCTPGNPVAGSSCFGHPVGKRCLEFPCSGAHVTDLECSPTGIWIEVTVDCGLGGSAGAGGAGGLGGAG